MARDRESLPGEGEREKSLAGGDMTDSGLGPGWRPGSATSRLGSPGAKCFTRMYLSASSGE